MPIRLKLFFKLFITISIIVLVLFAAWLYQLNQSISQRLEDGWFKPPVEIYSDSEVIKKDQRLNSVEVLKWLKSWGYRQADLIDTRLTEKQFVQLNEEECQARLENYDISGIDFKDCLTFRTPRDSGVETAGQIQLLVFNTDDRIKGLFVGDPLRLTDHLQLPPQLFSQFYNGEPILRTLTNVGDVPLQCLQAVTAIEDKNFLMHQGVSWTGTLRAVFKVIQDGRFSQGGSTITQQLVKNYFLTPEKTIRRKFVEIFMALLLEAQVSKDKILESYLNIVYMGQNGPFQVIGLHAASEYYFNKNVSDLELPECALLAAIINSPGRFNPWSKPEAALSRRKLVLEKMQEVGFIDLAEQEIANRSQLPTKKTIYRFEPARYYTQAVFRELAELNIDTNEGLRVYTYLNENAQDLAQRSVTQHVSSLEKGFASLAKKKEAGKDLQAAMISVNVENGGINALVGGRGFLKTQFNRALDGKRQVGSIMKPFVYLAALESKTPEGDNYDANTILSDTPFTYEYEGQSWSPKNYDKKFRGDIPLYVALKDSLNVPTAKLGLDVGLTNIIDVARRAGIQAEMKAFPSLTLGAFEISPLELVQSYLAFPRMGSQLQVRTIRKVESLQSDIYFENRLEEEQVFSPFVTANLVSMMQQTIETGTARRLRAVGFNYEAAGKTGTTSDTKDAWFAGYTPQLLTLAWVGYDDNTKSGLTGASGAVPLWLQFMTERMSSQPVTDFNWPEGFEKPELKPYSEN